MRRQVLFSIVAVAGLGSGGTALAQLPSQPYLYGVWQGVMTVAAANADGSPVVLPAEGAQQFPFRLDIRDTNLFMCFQNNDGSWGALGKGLDFRLNQQGRSAIVLVGMSDGSREPTSETWMLNLTRWDEEHLTVYLSQVKSRNSESGDAPTSFGALGQMMRISEDEGC